MPGGGPGRCWHQEGPARQARVLAGEQGVRMQALSKHPMACGRSDGSQPDVTETQDLRGKISSAEGEKQLTGAEEAIGHKLPGCCWGLFGAQSQEKPDVQVNT